MNANTAVKQLEEEFHLTLSKFSHELRNPIALVSSELQLLGSSHPEIMDYEGWDDIMDTLEYIKELLNELSDYNNAGKISRKPTDLGPYLHTVLDSVRPTLNYLGITLETDFPDSLPTVPLDPVKMRQALLNLLRNAQEAISNPSGKITVRVQTLERTARISIEDNGCGIPSSEKESIFTPFVTRKTSGTGLGLAITRQIIEAHNGHIEVDSLPGQGSVFRIFLGW